MAPRTYRAETTDGRRFTLCAGSDSGALALARKRGQLVSLARVGRSGRTVAITIHRTI